MTNPVIPDKDSDLSKKQQVEQMFDNIAHRYDFLNHFLSAGIDRSWRKKAINSLKDLAPKKLLDVATGTGDLAFEAWKRLKPAEIVGVDISEGMLEHARIKAGKRSLSHIRFERGDSENLSFPDNYFDAITVAFGVRNFENLKQGLKEMNRVLRPGGQLVVLEFSKPTIFPIKQLYNFYFSYILPFWGKIISKDSRAYTYLPESVRAFPEGPAFVGHLKEAGFSHAEARILTLGICSLYTAIK